MHHNGSGRVKNFCDYITYFDFYYENGKLVSVYAVKALRKVEL